MTTAAKIWGTLIATTVALATSAALAGDCCCECGHDNCGVRKVCRLVKETKKIEKICYGCECADICLPGKSCRGCLHCEDNCAEGCCTAGSSKEQKPDCSFSWFDWSPTCAKVVTKKKLTKFIMVKEVPSWKWKVEEVCGNCCPDHSCTAAADGTQVEKVSAQQVEAATAENATIPLPPNFDSTGSDRFIKRK